MERSNGHCMFSKVNFASAFYRIYRTHIDIYRRNQQMALIISIDAFQFLYNRSAAAKATIKRNAVDSDFNKVFDRHA